MTGSVKKLMVAHDTREDGYNNSTVRFRRPSTKSMELYPNSVHNLVNAYSLTIFIEEWLPEFYYDDNKTINNKIKLILLALGTT